MNPAYLTSCEACEGPLPCADVPADIASSPESLGRGVGKLECTSAAESQHGSSPPSGRGVRKLDFGVGNPRSDSQSDGNSNENSEMGLASGVDSIPKIAEGASASSASRHSESLPRAVEAQLSVASPLAADRISDPRVKASEGQQIMVKVVCFCTFDPEQVYDSMFGNSALGNFYDLGEGGLRIEAPCDKGKAKSFRNAEAAFHALKFWALAGGFSRLSGLAATQKQKRLAEHADLTYSGFGCAWVAMLAVLSAKFAAGSASAAVLLDTGDAFLLAHDPIPGRDSTWSDGCDGEGANLMGMMLMLVRDTLAKSQTWTTFLSNMFDLESGTALHDGVEEHWQTAVRAATLVACPQNSPMMRGR